MRRWLKRAKDSMTSVSVRILMIMIALVLPLNVIAIVYTNKAVNAIEEQAEFNIQKIVDYKLQELDNRMKVSKAFLTYFVTQDVDCLTIQKQDISDYTFSSAKMKVFAKIRSMYDMTEGADGYFYYQQNRKDGVIYANSDGYSELVGQLRNMLSKYSKEKNPTGWHIYQWNDKQYLVYLVRYEQILYGSAFRLDRFLEEIKSGIDYPVCTILFSEQEEKKDTQEKNLIVIQAVLKNIHLYVKADRMLILRQLSYSQQLMWKIAIVYLILIPILYVILRNILIRPLLQVNEAHQQIENGNGDFRIEGKPSAVEYRELYTSFNRMADHLKQYKIESYEKEISRQKMELRNLQLQIRPHFLLNTFNIIFSLAQRNENKMIQETVIYLSEYFRYIFRSGKELELFQKELKLIRGYIRTASIRYSGRVEASYDFDPELDFVRMPPLLIHNFVENAVKYGIKKEETLHIFLEGKYDDGFVTFIIEDDGKGMPAEMLDQNRRMFAGEVKPQNESQHLGLYNSLKRLRYFYGDYATIQVTSELNQGTCFTIKFPYNVEVEDESVDY